MLNDQDFALLRAKGITEAVINDQLKCFETGFPYLKIDAAASTQKGILPINEEDIKHYSTIWADYLNGEREIIKFVPASGAASRMFKDLFEFIEADYSIPSNDFEKKFFSSIGKFAFFSDLNDTCVRLYQKEIKSLISNGEYKNVVKALLNSDGLSYGNLPKGLLKFHFSSHSPRTPTEEHLVEGALYAANNSKVVKVHFTVSPEHKNFFESLVKEKVSFYEKEFGVTYQITFSEQKTSTDTIAADASNQPFRENGKLLFRPGGHGALIENLNDINADIVFVKNIDNVVPDNFKSSTVDCKKVIAGVLVDVQAQITAYLQMLDSGKYRQSDLIDIVHFLQNILNIRNNEIKTLEDADLVIYLRNKLNRPIRVCGMVKNIGEPGGGPFITQNNDGTWSLQILESSQIDLSKPEMKELLNSSTHFNPVDLVCGVKDYKGNKFDLTRYVDKNTGFISSKSKSGKELKALELPGLWNGAMSDWNTLFVEVPIETFNPVKTVNDLLRKEHQG